MRIPLLILSFLLSTGATAMPMLTTGGSGNVTGATGLEFGDMTFSMEFVDGSCESLFDGCDDDSDFIISGTTSTTHADVLPSFFDAFISDVLSIDDGSLDALPGLAVGCDSAASSCISISPELLWPPGQGQVCLGVIENRGYSSDAGDVEYGGCGVSATVSVDSTGFPNVNWARFTLKPADVPAPGSLALLALGLAGLGWSRRKKV